MIKVGIVDDHAIVRSGLKEFLAQQTDMCVIGDAPGELEKDLEFACGADSAGDIASTLSLSVKTVSTYRTRLMEKMDLNSNSDLTCYGLKHSLIA